MEVKQIMVVQMFSEEQRLTKKSFCLKMSFDRRSSLELAFSMDCLEKLSNLETNTEKNGGLRDMG